MSKVDRAIHGPTWAEVLLGAVLSLVLGVVIGALLLVLKPVVTATEMPKEPVAGTVYYLPGARDGSAGRQAMVKRKAFVAGQSVKVTEQEINALADAAAAPAAPAPAKPGEKAAPAPAASGFLNPGTPNVRIRNGTMQVGVPLAVDVFGFGAKIMVVAQGGFEKDGDTFAYEPSELYLGSCPVQRLPFLSSYVRKQLLAAHPVPEDIAIAWSKLANVTIEGNTLNLAMP